ncbi:hypothetical protein OFM52_28270, partial [Escherichia coli]|nr:hypothetical protein [Escherichia coli]
MSYDERSDGVISSLPMAIDNSTYRFKNSVYNPFAEILIYNDPKATFTIKILDKIEEDNKILKKFIVRANKSINYNTVSTKDRR